MGSKTFDGVRFSAFSDDHLPRHVHGYTEGVTVIVDLLEGGEVALSDRLRPTKPLNPKRSIVSKVLRIAGRNVDELNALWEKTHGTR